MQRSLEKNSIQEIDKDVEDSVLITSSLLELSNKRIRRFNRKKTLKWTKGVRKEIHRIKGIVIKKGLYYCVVEVKEFRVPRNFWRRMKIWKLLTNVLQTLLIISILNFMW